MNETHTMTTTQDIPDDIREALKIREDLDGISGELLGYKGSAVWLVVLRHAVLMPVQLLGVFGFCAVGTFMCVGSTPNWVFDLFTSVSDTFARLGTNANTVLYGIFGLVGLALYGFMQLSQLIVAVRFEHPSFGQKVKLSNVGLNKHGSRAPVSLSFALGPTQCGFMNHPIAYTKIEHVSVVDVTSVLWTRIDSIPIAIFLPLKQKRPCIRIHVAGKRAPIEVMLDVRMKREAEWLVEQIQARMAAAQSGTIPEDLTRLTKQAGQTTLSDAFPRQTLSNPPHRITKIR